MERAGGDDVGGVGGGEDEGVVGDGTEFVFDCGAHIGDGVLSCADDLGDAPEGIGVLHAGVVGLVAREDLRACKESADLLGDARWPGLMADIVDAGIEVGIGGAAGVDGHCGGAEGGAREALGVGECEHALGCHEVGAVDEGEAFFGAEFDWGDFCLGEGVRAGEGCAVESCFAFTDEHERDMGERREVARCADGADCGDDGGDACVQQMDDLLDDDRTDARVPACEGGGEDEHHRSDGFFRERVADACGVRAEDVVLDGGDVRVGDAFACEGAEAGVDAVDRVAFCDGGEEGGVAVLDALFRGGGERDGSVVTGDGFDLVDGERGGGEFDGGHASGRSVAWRVGERECRFARREVQLERGVGGSVSGRLGG